MKFLKAWVALAWLCSAAPAPAQEPAFLRLDPSANRQVFAEGTVITPSSSIPQPRPGVAHTNVHIFQPAGVPAITRGTASPAVGPPVSGLFFETPQSVACVYHFVVSIPGCNPDLVVNTPRTGSRTIAIVDAYHAPNAVADLTTFSQQFGLPLPTANSFQVFCATSAGTITQTPPAYDAGWETEISLDIQWAHAMAPNATIILVEAFSNLNSDLLAAVTVANNLLAPRGGGEISMSWGSTELSNESSLDTYFLTPGIVYFASTGDSPGTSWPSVSANVVAVGGTTISRNPTTGNLVGEAAWTEGGGGVSEFILKPPYQHSVGKLSNSNYRGVPDVAAVANPRTGVWVFNFNAGGWIVVGGTSVSSPVVAALVNSLSKFHASSAAELTQDYTVKATSPFTDIVEGICGPNAGYWTAQGWDFCTGLGSPVNRQ
jgi:kumamolisin